MLYRRGNVWWFQFAVRGRRIRESSGTTNRRQAAEVERKRRSEVERAASGLSARPSAKRVAALVEDWLAGKRGVWAENLQARAHFVLREFGKRFPAEITAAEVGAYQKRRLAAEVAPRTVNIEVGCLRGALRSVGHWERLAAHVHQLREAKDVGRAVDPADERRLLEACRKSQSPALFPAVLLAIDTGLRRGELRELRFGDLRLHRDDSGAVVSGDIIVRRAKTAAGEGRTVPLSRRVCAMLTAWLQHFPAMTPASYLFPVYRIAAGAEVIRLWDLNLGKPMGSFARAWRTAQRAAATDYRWHDLRHTFVTRLLENPSVSEMTVKALAGHVSARMLERYSHIRQDAKRAAIDALHVGGCGDIQAHSLAHSARLLEVDRGAK